MGESGREWEDVFDGIPIQDQMKRRRRIAFHVSESTMTKDDRDDLIADLEDEAIQFSEDELQSMEIAAKMNARRPRRQLRTLPERDRLLDPFLLRVVTLKHPRRILARPSGSWTGY